MLPAARLRLLALSPDAPAGSHHDFHVRAAARQALGLEGAYFAVRGDVVFVSPLQAQAFAEAVNRKRVADGEEPVRAADVNAMGLLHEILHAVIALHHQRSPNAGGAALEARIRAELGADYDATLRAFVDEFPPPAVVRGEATAAAFLAGATNGVPHTQWVLEELLLLFVSNANPAYAPLADLITDQGLKKASAYDAVIASARTFYKREEAFGPDGESLFDLLLAPARHSPGSLSGQLAYVREHWGLLLEGSEFLRRVLFGVDFLKEEGKWFQPRGTGGGEGDSRTPRSYRPSGNAEPEPEAFSADRQWMPNVVLLAKSTYVWLHQLERRYGRPIRTLRDVPDEELDAMAARGMTGLWLIGLWRRSRASARIKHIMGKEDAVASAYSLDDYAIAEDLGGESAYADLKARAGARGLRLASDMVPNHMGIDSRWVKEHPHWFVQRSTPPFPGYRFGGEDLGDDAVGIHLEDGYFNHSDAAVVFQRTDKRSGRVSYVYHGNDGTSMPWNDTAQLDYTQAEVREGVLQTILHVARMFPIIRFDAAMTLAKRHYQRLWFPLPGQGGDIPSRAESAMTKEEFDAVFPIEFWREVVDRVAVEVPDTLLLAEAFWMMEGYFVRSLGMHRVYNSAFMNMLKREENANYRTTVKNVLEYNPQILKRFVNFMNNPDEETAIAQFGRDDKYFGVCIVMSTMPGLPMFGHGQVEGLTEKYGMEYRRPRFDEEANEGLVARHEHEVFPVLKKRYLFSEVDEFVLYDVYTPEGHVDEDVFAYSNRVGAERALVVFHNKFKDTRGWIRTSVGFLGTDGKMHQRNLGDGLRVPPGEGAFTIFRDHISGLEYIRGARSLREQGLYVELGAFKYHVFWQFRDVFDAPGTPYRRLCEELQGRGVASMDDALLALLDAPVFGPLRALFTDASPALAGVPDAGAKALDDALDGVAAALGNEVTAEGADAVKARARAAYARLVATKPPALAADAPAPSPSPAPAPAPAPARPSAPDVTAPAAVLGDRGVFLYGLALVALGAAEELASTPMPSQPLARPFFVRRLHRLLEQVLRAHGAPEGLAAPRALLAGVALGARGPLGAWLRACTDTPAGGLAFGVNTFEGVTYLSKERLEEGLALARLARVVSGLGAAAAELDAKEANALHDAAAQEGYRTAALRAEAAPKATPPRTTTPGSKTETP